MSRLHVPLLAAALAVLGLGIASYKVLRMGYPTKPSQTVETWIAEARLAFEPTGGAVKATLLLPRDPPGFEILDENFVSRGYGLTTDELDGSREAVWTTRRPSGRQALYYRATLFHTPATESPASPSPPLPKVPEDQEPYQSAAKAILDEVRRHSADIVTFSSVLVQELNRASPSENVQLVLPRNAGDEQKVRTAIHLLAGARIPARMVRVIPLIDGGRDIQPQPWLEVHNGERWVPIHPSDGLQGYPDNVAVWWRGDRPAYEVSRARNIELKFSVSRGFEEALDTASRRTLMSESGLSAVSLLNLPVQTQNLYRVLLTIPVGVLLIVFLRNVIGIQTFGTFMPVLIALSFRETDLAAGVALFSAIVALGLFIRFYLEHLKLLMVPRLGAVVIIVILLMAALSILSHRLRFEVGLSVALFPMVILAMTIERMSIVWEEHGAGDAIRQGIGSLIVATACYLLMFNEWVEHLVFVFPELLLVILAITLALGRYTGYRLSELLRFRAITGG